MVTTPPSILAVLLTVPRELERIHNTPFHISVIGIGIGILITVLIRWFYLGLVGAMLKRGVVRGKPAESAPGFFLRASHGRMHYGIRTANGRVAADIDPSRPLVVLVHGFAGSSDVFTDDSRSAYAKILSEAGFDVLTFDNFGHGHSDGPDIVYSVELFCSQLCELLLSLEVQSPFDLVGLSMGASTAVLFTHRHGHLVKHLVLQAPSVCEVPLEFRLQIALRIPFLRELLCLLIIPRIGEGACEDNPAAIRSSFRLLLTRLASGGSWGMGDEGKTCAMLKEIEQVHNDPILVLWGEKDSVCVIKEVDIVKRLAPSALVYIQPEADHMDFADGPVHVRDFFRDRLVEYLESRRSTLLQG